MPFGRNKHLHNHGGIEDFAFWFAFLIMTLYWIFSPITVNELLGLPSS